MCSSTNFWVYIWPNAWFGQRPKFLRTLKIWMAKGLVGGQRPDFQRNSETMGLAKSQIRQGLIKN
jgi:hypothetical protein